MHNSHWFRSFIAFILTSFLTSCATAPTSIDPIALSSFERVGVLSLTGDKLFYFQVGRTVFGNESEEFEILDLDLDDAWENAIADNLAETVRFEVVNLDLDRTPLYFSASPPSEKWPANPPAIELQALAEANDLDAILVFGPSGRDYGRAGVVVSGVSIVRENRFIANNVAHYWLEAALHLVDGATGEVLAVRPVGQKDFLGLYNSLLEPVPAELVETLYSDYTEEQKEFFRNTYLELPAPHWRPAIAELFAEN